MKNIFSKLSLSLVAVSVLFAVSYASADKSAIVVKTSESFGLRSVDVEDEDSVVPEETKYGKNSPGTSHKIKRAYQNAPPMIPHDTEGMLPITINDNQCIMCHMPAAAKEMGMKATPIPKSHFINFRPQHKLEGEDFIKVSDDMKNETTISKLDGLSNARFNCSACHAPQSKGELVKSTFKPQYTDKNGAHKSSWFGSKLTEGLDTVNGK